MPADPSGARTTRRSLILVTTLALALRAWPLHVPYLHPDQEFVPGMALHALASHSWRPDSLVYPSGLFMVLRTAYGAVATLGAGPEHLVHTWTSDPWPFLLVARVWSCLMGVIAVALTGLLGTHLLGRPWGAVAALLLAVSPVHVRESHWGALDVPAGALLLASLAALARSRIVRGRGWSIAAGAFAGAAMAFRWQAGTALLALPLVELTDGRRSMHARIGRLAVGGLAALGTFALLSPYALLDPAQMWHDLGVQAFVSFLQAGPPSLPIATMLALGMGVPACGLALIGLVAALRARPSAVAVAALVTIPLLASMLFAERIFIRYTVPLLPFVALGAAAGVAAIQRQLAGGTAIAIGVGLVAIAIVDPLARSVATVRLLAREDTRHLAGRWLVEHAPAGTTLLVPGPAWYSNPVLPPGRFRLSSYAWDGSTFNPAEPGARFLITTQHPGLPSQGTVPPTIAAWLEHHARPVAQFRALVPGGTPGLFEPPDANFLPLRGFTDAVRPGPDIVVWQLPEPPQDGTSGMGR